MKKRILCITLLCIMLFSNTVYGFTDVVEEDWFFKDVVSLQEQGVISGYTDNTFKPYSNVSYGEVLKMVMTIASIEPNKSLDNSHWASGYYSKALELDILDNTVANRLSESITREEVANLVVKSLKLGKEQVDVALNTFKDTNDINVEILFNIGVVNGVQEEYGLYFKPDNSITRAEISAILVRVQNYKLGISNTLEVPEIAEEVETIELHKAVKDEEINFSKEPMTQKELEKVLLYMASSGTYEYTLSYDKGIDVLKDKKFKNEVSLAFNKVFSYYPEYFSFTNQLTYKLTGTTTKTDLEFKLLNPNFDIKTVDKMRVEFVEKSEVVVKELIADGTITDTMTDIEKAKILYDWVTLNTTYDRQYTPESYTGYGQIKNGLAVCQGYTATFNYMSKLLGLKVQGISGIAGEEHIWTLAEIDGKKVHIDTTWGDAANTEKPNYDYFGATTEFMRKTHSWDSSKFEL